MDAIVSSAGRRRIAVIGAGISGLSCAWALSRAHDVTLFEALPRLGGHSHTVEVEGTKIDTGFIVYNEPAYPNLTALFAHLGVETRATDMSFSVSLREGGLEYAGTDLRGLFAQPANALRPRFWSMLRGILRFYKRAPGDAAALAGVSLGEYLRHGGYSEAFLQDHLYPMIAAVWSCPAGAAGDLPAAAFIRFCENHGLLKLTGRPVWRSVAGGSQAYVAKLRAAFAGKVRAGQKVARLRRLPGGVALRLADGAEEGFDEAVLACHADEAYALLADPCATEAQILGSFRTTANEVVLHGDAAAMPRRRAAWAAWNYTGGDAHVAVTYWMNRLQGLAGRDWFVTLNPTRELRDVALRQIFTHPVFDVAALRAQARIWEVQGLRRTWFCGAWWGAGFHEDGLQAGLAVAEALGAPRRPWNVEGESARIAPRPAFEVAG